MSVTHISMSQAKELISQDPSIKIIDVRTPLECKDGTIPQAIQNDVMDINAFLARAQSYDKHATYVMYCRSGGRSRMAAEFLSNNGFKNIYNCTQGYSAY